MSKKWSFIDSNLPQLEALCKELGFELEYINQGQYRVYGATHVFDIWPARMTYHRIKGENIKSVEPYYKNLDRRFNKDQVKKLLLEGEI